jgi:hypothetical protein
MLRGNGVLSLGIVVMWGVVVVVVVVVAVAVVDADGVAVVVVVVVVVVGEVVGWVKRGDLDLMILAGLQHFDLQLTYHSAA